MKFKMCKELAMFHFVFNANENYIPYLAVLCYSLVQNTDQRDRNKRRCKPYCFHLLSDGMSLKLQTQLKLFEQKLNQFYPCKFQIYILDDKEFEGLPKLNGNYLTYFRLKIPEILPTEVKTCLYLDVDMLCVGDVRKVFEIQMGHKICGAVLDAHYSPCRIMRAIDGGQDLMLDLASYFNAGFLLIDLWAWRRENIQNLCFEFLAHYQPQWHDQDTLNAVLKDRIFFLPLQWNFMVGHFEAKYAQFKTNEGNQGIYTISYTKEEMIHARKEMKILHFLTDQKPWIKGINPLSCFYKQWWKMAIQTPVFGNRFRVIWFGKIASYFLMQPYELLSKLLYLLIQRLRGGGGSLER